MSRTDSCEIQGQTATSRSKADSQALGGLPMPAPLRIADSSPSFSPNTTVKMPLRAQLSLWGVVAAAAFAGGIFYNSARSDTAALRRDHEALVQTVQMFISNQNRKFDEIGAGLTQALRELSKIQGQLERRSP